MKTEPIVIIAKATTLVIAVALAVCALASCSGTSGSSSASSNASSAASGSSATAPSSSGASSAASSSAASSFAPVSVVKFDAIQNADRLVADMKTNVIPVSCAVCYDEMGSRPTVTVSDPETIKQIYSLLSNVTVEGPSQESITDSYHYVCFELLDGTKVSFNFEGERLLSLGRENYSVSGGGPLWQLVRQIQDDYTETEEASVD